MEDNHVEPTYNQLDFYPSERAEYCRKYKIKGDNSMFDIYNGEVKAEFKYCLSIGSCSIFPRYQDSSFRYDLYMTFLNKRFKVYTDAPLIFYVFHKEDILTYIQADWINDIDYSKLNDRKLVWDSFVFFKQPINPIFFRDRYYQTRLIESNKTFTVLTYAQFQQVYGFMDKYVQKPGTSWRKLEKVSKSEIYYTRMYCKFCDGRSVFILHDCFHELVFLKFEGSHHNECLEKNIQNCYKAYRNLFINDTSTDSMTIENYIKTTYANCYSTISKCGILPSSATLCQWKQKYYSLKKNGIDSYKKSDIGDYYKCAELMIEALNKNEILTKRKNSYISVPKSDGQLVHHFNYDDGLPGFIFASEISLFHLSNAESITCDAKSHLLEQGKVRFIKINFEQFLHGGTDGRLFLGCIATLPHAEKAVHYQKFFNELKNFLHNTFNTSFQCKTVLTDDSKAQAAGATEVLGNQAKIRTHPCNIRLTFEANHNGTIVNLLMDAMYSISEEMCIHYLLKAMEWYYNLREEFNKHPQQDMRWVSVDMKKMDKFEIIKGFNVPAFLKWKMMQLNDIYKSRSQWSLFAVFDDDNANPLSSFGIEMILFGDLESMKKKFQYYLKMVSDVSVNDVELTPIKLLASNVQFESELTDEEVKNAVIKIKDFYKIYGNRLIEGLRIDNLTNIVEFSDSIVTFFAKHDRRWDHHPMKLEISRDLQKMEFAKYLPEYKKMMLNDEFIEVYSQIHDLEPFTDSEDLISCEYCLQCCVARIPCSHVIGGYLYDYREEFGDVNFKNFVRKLDDILIKKFCPDLYQRKSRTRNERDDDIVNVKRIKLD